MGWLRHDPAGRLPDLVEDHRKGAGPVRNDKISPISDFFLSDDKPTGNTEEECEMRSEPDILTKKHSNRNADGTLSQRTQSQTMSQTRGGSPGTRNTFGGVRFLQPGARLIDK